MSQVYDDSGAPASAGDPLWKGFVLVAVAVVVGALVMTRIDRPSIKLAATGTTTTVTRPGAGAATTTIPVQGTTSTTAVALKAPKDVKVLVVNASSVTNGGRKVYNVLQPGGYNLFAPVEATAAVKKATTASVVYFLTDAYQREAAALGQVLQLPAGAVQARPATLPARDPGANILILVANDLANKTLTPLPSVPGSSSSTTRTTAPTPTTKPRSTTTTKKP